MLSCPRCPVVLCVRDRGDNICCGVCHSGWCVVFSVMWSKLLMTSAISCPLWSSVYECREWSVRTEYGMFVMYCMQCCMSVSAAL